MKTGDVVSFADDTVVFYKSNNWNDLKAKVGNDFRILISFFISKLLTINEKKTKFMVFSNYAHKFSKFIEPNINTLNRMMNINVTSST